jgi:hypothetical protein
VPEWPKANDFEYLPFLLFVLSCNKMVPGWGLGQGLGHLPCFILCLTTGSVVPADVLVRGILSSSWSLRRGRRMGLPSRRIFFIFPGPEDV